MTCISIEYFKKQFIFGNIYRIYILTIWKFFDVLIYCYECFLFILCFSKPKCLLTKKCFIFLIGIINLIYKCPSYFRCCLIVLFIRKIIHHNFRFIFFFLHIRWFCIYEFINKFCRILQRYLLFEFSYSKRSYCCHI
ncbi:MAG: hypothetical protein SPLUMA2_SPLUMAMAG2_00635 [uncultured Sulfurimonas sp.]|nr:MAG: hypothetical protein SPLUMA2_SPLUMAMAG2_00635 [uncultured Sulfurimonas sp.]